MNEQDAQIMEALREIFREPHQYEDGSVEDYQISGADLVDWLDAMLKEKWSLPRESAVAMGLIQEVPDER